MHFHATIVRLKKSEALAHSDCETFMYGETSTWNKLQPSSFFSFLIRSLHFTAVAMVYWMPYG